MAHYADLDLYRLTPRELHALGDRGVEVTVRLANHRLTPALVRMTISARRDALVRRAKRWLVSLLKIWPAAEAPHVIRLRRRPSEVVGTVPARSLRRLARHDGVDSVRLLAVEGMRPRPRVNVRLGPGWYSVRAVVAVEVEGQRRGLQMVDDRIILVRANDPRQAERRASRLVRDGSSPYLNPYDGLVRWRLDSIAEVYQSHEDAIDPQGTEIYSSIRSRRIRPRR